MAINIQEFDLKQISQPNKARIALSQISAPIPSDVIPDIYLDSKGKNQKAVIIQQQIELIRTYLQRAIFEKPNFILFPELSIPWEMQDELKGFAQKENIYLIGGLFYSPNFENTCAVFTPIVESPIYYQHKLNRAPKEDVRTKEGNQIIVFKNTGFGSFTAIICYDFTSLQILYTLRKHDISIIFLPTYNQSVELFDKIGKSICYTVYSYVALCNVSAYGNTAAYGPIRMQENKRLPQEFVIGMITGNSDFVYPVEFNISDLNVAIERFREGKEVPLGFITPPADLREPNVILSPYTPLEPARDNFVCREEQQVQFRNCIEQGRHFLLLGPSGTGKTSLIYKLRKSVSAGVVTGFIEVYDNEKTFDFFRRLAHEISIQVQQTSNDAYSSNKLQEILDDIKKTREKIDNIGYESAFQAYSVFFHELANNLNSRLKGQKIVIFIDQAERLAWLEEKAENQPFAIRLLIRVMKDFQRLDFPIYLGIAVRQHDYDPLIVLANEQLPVAIISIRKFEKREIESAIKDPLPINITIENDVVLRISDISGGTPFFVQLLADFTFKNLRGRSKIDIVVFEELGLNNQEDLYPLIMNSVNNNEKKIIEAFAIERGYTVDIDTIARKLGIVQSELKLTIDQLLGKNIIEELETARFRFVHDRFKSFVQLEWLVTKQSNIEKLQIEAETIIQLLGAAPKDEIIANFNYAQTSITCFKAIFLNDFQTVIRLLDHLLRMSFRGYAVLFEKIIETLYKTNNDLFAEELLKKMSNYLLSNKFFNELASCYAIEILLGLNNIKQDKIYIAINYKIQGAEDYAKNEKQIDRASDSFAETAEWAERIGNIEQQKELLTKAINYKIQAAESNIKEENFNRASNSFVVVAGWEEKIGNIEQQKKLLAKAISYKIQDAKADIKDKDFYNASNSFAEAAHWSEKIGNIEQQKKLLTKAINYKIREAENDIKEENFSDAADTFAKTAEWAEKIGDIEQQKKLLTKAINYKIREAENDIREKYFNAVSDSFAESSQWAEKIGNIEQHKNLLTKAIEYKVQYAENSMSEKDIDNVFYSFSEATEWAGKIGNTEQQKELLTKAIEYKAQKAEENIKQEKWQEAIIDFVDAAELIEKYDKDNITSLEKFFERGIELTDKIKYEYNTLTKSLLTNHLSEAISSISRYCDKINPERSKEYQSISAIIESSRDFMGEHADTSRYMIHKKFNSYSKYRSQGQFNDFY